MRVVGNESTAVIWALAVYVCVFFVFLCVCVCVNVLRCHDH